MNKEKKQLYIAEMTKQLDNSEAVIVAHYQGLTVKLDKSSIILFRSAIILLPRLFF